MLAKMDELGTPAWAFAVVFGLWLFWPLGLVVLAYLVWSGRLRAMDAAPGRWSDLRAGIAGWLPGWSWASSAAPSGNRAFDHHREQTSRRLEEERDEFQTYLERLRRSRDEAEFNRFMAERRHRPDAAALAGPDQEPTETSA